MKNAVAALVALALAIPLAAVFCALVWFARLWTDSTGKEVAS